MPVVLDEIVVTAEKREADLQDVPMTVAAFSAAQIESAGIDTPEQAIAMTSNVSLSQSFTVGNSYVTIRGISQVNNTDPPITVAIDGVYQGNQKQLVQELYDIERIEVLKGPQGALYGRNALGGAINIITRQPSNQFGGGVRAGAGNGSSYSLSAALRGALVKDKLQFTVAGSYKDSDGWIDNVFLKRKADPYRDVSGRAILKGFPRERTWWDLRLSTSDTEGGAVLYTIFPSVGHANDFRYQPDENILGFSRRDMDDAALRLVHEGRAVVVTSITGWSKISEIYRGDGDFSNPARSDISSPLGPSGQGQNLDVRLLSQEIRLASNGGGRLQWITGVYLLNTDRDLDSFVFVDSDGTITGFLPVFAVSEDDDNRALAGFGQIDWRLTGRWQAGFGLRFDKDERRQRDLASGLRREAAFDEWQPKLTLRYLAGDKAMLYLNASTGFRSGGLNAPGVTPQVFGKETATSVELGAKSTLWSNRLRLNGAAYAMQVDGFHFFQVDFARGGQVVDNIQDVEIRGIEVDLAARLRAGWDAYLAAGVNDSEIRDFDGSGRYVGNQTPLNTRSKVSLGVQHSHPLGDRYLAVGRIDVERRGKQYWGPDNLDVQDPLTLVNVRLGIEGEVWAVTLWSRNLTDERYYTEYADATWLSNAISGDLGHPARPRSFGIDLKRGF